MENPVESWKNYLEPTDFEFLRDFVSNTKNGIKIDKMVLLVGLGSNGKTTLIKQIINYIGPSECAFADYTKVMTQSNKKLFIHHEESLNNWAPHILKLLSSDPIKGTNPIGQTFLFSPKTNLIGEANYLEPLESQLKSKIYVIPMNHQF